MSDETTPETEHAEASEENAEHKADREPTAEEEAAAERNELDEDVARNYREAIETGAELKGEGEIA